MFNAPVVNDVNQFALEVNCIDDSVGYAVFKEVTLT